MSSEKQADAPPVIEIEDHSDRRTLRLRGPAFYSGRWHPDGATFSHRYSEALLRELFRVKGAFINDELQRLDDPGYLQEQFIDFILTMAPLQGATVLDFGSGCSSSSVLLARAGAKVSAVELMPRLRNAARLRVAEEGLLEQIDIVDAESMTSLPFSPESFDIVALNAVVEHIRPEERRAILRHLWTLLKRNGLLVITETPNRLWPFEGHTTRLPFVSWMPVGLACRAARMLRPREFGTKSRDELIYDGICGSTWWSIRSCFPPDAVSVTGGGAVAQHRAYFERLRGRKAGFARVVVELLHLGLYPAALLTDLFRAPVPSSAFYPYLDIAFRKRSL